MPVLLIDNIVRLEEYAGTYGYYREMKDFILKFLDFEPDKCCFLYLQVGDVCLEKDQRSSRRGDYTCYYHGYTAFNSPRVTMIADNFCEKVEAGVIKTDQSLKIRVCDTKRIYVRGAIEKIGKNYIDRLIEEEVLKERQKWKKKERFERRLDPSVPKLSPYMGIREYKFEKRGRYLEKINKHLKQLYEKASGCKCYEDLYSIMQNVDRSRQTDWDSNKTQALLDELKDIREGWRVCRHNSDSYWEYIRVDRIGDYHFDVISAIKVYITCKHDKISDAIRDLIRELVTRAEHEFVLKISRFHRDESACFWVRKSEFCIIRDYFKIHRNLLRKGLPFIAHMDGLGISHDLMDIDSHNAQQAKMIWDYFQLMKSADEIDIDNMYSHYVEGWNGIPYDRDDLFKRDFEDSRAQTFVILMDTFDYITGRRKFTENSLLISDDPETWRILTDAICWGDVGKI